MNWKGRLLAYATITALYAGAAFAAVYLLQKFHVINVVGFLSDHPDEILGPTIVPAASLLLVVGILLGTALAFPNRMKWFNDNFR